MSIRERLLIRRLRDRDERAFREVVDQHRQSVYNLTLRMLGDAAEAEDVAQEVFITVFKSIDGFRGDAKLSTWIYRIAANQCKNRIKYLARRKSKSRVEYDDDVGRHQSGGVVAAPANLRQPDTQLEGVQLEAMVSEAIASLDEDYRLVVVLRDIEELSYEDICQITGLPEGTVKSRLHRARMALRKKLRNV
ncbi:MAG TPA: sigma-70 family RNA polymerase sigma factor [Kofleriaceae bacterium]|nr:sigma-70 family RNA polymerase sigma factor [Kofleriaceae bacterium]